MTSLTSSRSARRRHPLQLEQLESRLVLATGLQPTAVEQLFLEELNDARANPAAYGASIGLDLSNVAPSQPLAFSPLLIQAAREHSQDMSARGYFAHVTPEGIDPGDRLTAVGFPWNGFGESIAGGSAYPNPSDALAGLITDSGVPDLGHRRQLLAIDSVFKTQNQVGIGAVQNSAGPLVNYYTIDSASTFDSRPFITGVVFNDAKGNGKYDVGEGLGGVTITVAGVGSTTTFDSGSYSFQANPGTYVVTASGGGLASPVTQTVALGTTNARLNFVAQPGGPVTIDPHVDAFIRKLYQADLNRPASDAEVGLWRPIVAGPNGLAVVANAIGRSQEARTILVKGWYRTYLGRDAGGGEEQFWVGLLGSGATEEQALAGILGSVEFYQRAAGQNPGLTPDQAYVQTLFQTFLNRTAGPDEVNNFVTFVLGGPGRSAAATIVLLSPEYRATVVTSYYTNLLHRTTPPGADEINGWVASSLDLASIRIGFMSSNEYFLNG
jgi:uncharacterized protein YkwD